MLNLTIFIILGLATWSLASLLVGERGPYAIFERLRKTAGVIKKEDADAEQLNRWLEENPSAIPPGSEATEEFVPDCIAFNELGMGLCCIWCTTMWIAILVALFACIMGWIGWWWFPVYFPALRSFALFWNMALERLDVSEK